MARELTAEQIEREQVEWVFGLTGGELDDTVLTYVDTDGKSGTFRYHYDGVPEWAAADYDDRHDAGVDYFTVVTCCLYGYPDETIEIDGRSYRRVGEFQTGGETQCCCKDWRQCGEERDPFEGQRCPYCERAPGEEHGYIYIGDGWCEIVYRHAEVTPECEGGAS